MEKVLCLECATNVCSVAIIDRQGIIAIKEDLGPNKHSESLTLYIEDVLKDSGLNINDITHVAVSDGPGSYTGLRIGASAGKAICYIKKTPLIVISSLTALCQTSLKQNKDYDYHLALIDARRQDAYISIMDKRGAIIKDKIFVTLDNNFRAILDGLNGTISVSGSGANKLKELYSDLDHHQTGLLSSASNMQTSLPHFIDNQEFTDYLTFEPYYLNKPNITKSKKNLL